MEGEKTNDLLTLLDGAPLNRRYWIVFVLLAALAVFELFDFLVGRFLVGVLAPQWHATYFQAATMLGGESVGAIIGVLVSGGFADAGGRRRPLIIGTFICAVSAGSTCLVPDDSWQIFAMLRFFVGVGGAAGLIAALIILTELTPTRRRTLLTASYFVCAMVGSLLMLRLSQAFFVALGWRGVALLGIMPAFVGVLIWHYVPESARWLVAKGRFVEARAAVAQHLPASG